MFCAKGGEPIREKGFVKRTKFRTETLFRSETKKCSLKTFELYKTNESLATSRESRSET